MLRTAFVLPIQLTRWHCSPIFSAWSRNLAYSIAVEKGV